MSDSTVRDGDVSGLLFEQLKDTIFFFKKPGRDYGQIEKLRGKYRIHSLDYRHFENKPELTASDLRAIAAKQDELNGVGERVCECKPTDRHIPTHCGNCGLKYLGKIEAKEASHD